MQLTFTSSRSFWFGGVFALVLLAPSLPAQPKPDAGEKSVNDLYQKHRVTIRQLLAGTVEPAKEPEAVTALVQTHVYRYTWTQARDPGYVLQLMKEFDGDLEAIVRNKPNTEKLQTELTKQIVALSEEMFGNREQLARVNYTRVLSRLAQDGLEEVSTPLVKAIQDEQQSDGVKYWAFQGLRELFSRGHQIPPLYLKDKKREADAIVALIGFIDRKPSLGGLTADEIEGTRILRREAIRALALSRYPAVIDAKKEVVGRTAQVLMRVISGEGFTPEVKLDEKIEAALGLCRMQTALHTDYQPDAAAPFIGLAVVELANDYSTNKDMDNGWKVKGARFSEALAALKSEMDVKKNRHLNPGGVKYVIDMYKDADILVRQVENKAGSAVPANFNNWLRSTPPPSETVYKNLPDSKVKIPEAPGN